MEVHKGASKHKDNLGSSYTRFWFQFRAVFMLDRCQQQKPEGKTIIIVPPIHCVKRSHEKHHNHRLVAVSTAILGAGEEDQIAFGNSALSAKRMTLLHEPGWWEAHHRNIRTKRMRVGQSASHFLQTMHKNYWGTVQDRILLQKSG